MDDRIPELADSIYREKVRRAREFPGSRKMGSGPRLFSEACGRMRSGIRMQFPDADEAEVADHLRKRLARLDRLNEFGIFRPAAKDGDR